MPPLEPAPTSPKASAQSTVLGWLLPPLFLSAVGLGLWLVLDPPENIIVWTAGFFATLGLLWVLISTVFPRGSAERTCPACGSETLVRADPTSTRGLVCSKCLWKDDSVSSFFMAEEEDASIESSILAARRKKREPLVIRSWTGPAEVSRRDQSSAASGSAENPTDSK